MWPVRYADNKNAGKNKKLMGKTKHWILAYLFLLEVYSRCHHGYFDYGMTFTSSDLRKSFNSTLGRGVTKKIGLNGEDTDDFGLIGHFINGDVNSAYNYCVASDWIGQGNNVAFLTPKGLHHVQKIRNRILACLIVYFLRGYRLVVIHRVIFLTIIITFLFGIMTLFGLDMFDVIDIISGGTN